MWGTLLLFRVQRWRNILLTALTLVLLVTGCRSGGETIPIPDPYVSGVSHFDIAFRLVQDSTLSEILHVYSDAALGFTEIGRLDRAEATLRRLNDQFAARRAAPVDTNTDSASASLEIDARLRHARAWQALAGEDEQFVSDARVVTDDVVDAVTRLGDQNAATGAEKLLDVLDFQLDNPNLEEDAVRRTLDELYLIDDDAVRAATLVDAADIIAARDDPRTLNPVVQQAIAIVPIVESSLVAMSLNARLARLSVALDRPGDVVSLIDQALRRAAAGLVVEAAQFVRIEEAIESLRSIDRTDVLTGDRTAIDTAFDLLTNVSPQSMRARSYGYLAIVLDDGSMPDLAANTYDDAQRQMAQIADNTMRATVTADFIRRRAETDPDWDAETAAGTLLAQVTLAGMSGVEREHILADLTTAFYVTDSVDAFDRIRGLIVSVDEYNRVLLRAAKTLLDGGRESEAVAAVDAMDGIPEIPLEDGVVPRLRVARIWRDVGSYDRAIIVAEQLPDFQLASFLTTLPADYLPDPVSNAVLERIDRRG